MSVKYCVCGGALEFKKQRNAMLLLTNIIMTSRTNSMETVRSEEESRISVHRHPCPEQLHKFCISLWTKSSPTTTSGVYPKWIRPLF